jgi:two-component system, NarL family, sensor histidine kinase UhpB
VGVGASFEGVEANPRPSLPLYWNVCLINGVVFVAGTAVLALSPATVSSPVLAPEVIILAVGLAVILLTNALLLRTSLAPVDRLIRFMDGVDMLQPGQRLPDQGSGSVALLVHTFNSMLARLENERRASNARALAAQEGERRRIAQELHDEVGQSLTVVLLGLKRVIERTPDELASELRAIQEGTRESLDEVRHVARRLRPGVLDDLGLLSALNALATDFTAHSNVHVRRRFTPGLPRLTREAELVIYRIAQEALTNVARHADADSVELSLTMRGEVVALRVIDDGRGLGLPAEGAGIRGMRERALLVDGRISIGPGNSGGTEVQLIVPLEQAP